jgi:7-cyano-7-deazaguanine reductase
MSTLGHLGQKSNYPNQYNPDLLFAIPRQNKRMELGLNIINPGFYGVDIWNHYEISWLDSLGKPCVAIGKITYSALSPNIIESKSMKLYFNSFNATKFGSKQELITTVIQDLSKKVESPVTFELLNINTLSVINAFQGICLDQQMIVCDAYSPNPDFLTYENTEVSEELYSDLLKSNCAITLQPDWGSIYISYSGKKINHAGLLKFIVSLRNNNEFHEQCVEYIFTQIMLKCSPKQLSVYACYTRRGGIDINPFRSSNIEYTIPKINRLMRQ